MGAIGQTNFGALDWAIVGAYLLGSAAIGFYVRKYVHSMVDYVAAHRGIRTALGVATLTGTELGLVTVMYSAQKGFVGGFAAFHIAALAGAVTLLVGLTGFIVARLRTEGVITIPEYYERRFGRKTRILGGFLLVFGGVLNMGLFLKVGSMFVVGITGLEHGFALVGVMITLLALVLLYTVLGGMISVVITDYVQFVVLAFGFLLATFMAIAKLGWNNIFSAVARLKGEAGFNPLLEGTFGTDYVVWMAFLGLVSCAVWPTAVARALAAKDEATVKRQYTWASVSFLIRFLVPYFFGICAFVYIMGSPDLKEAFFPLDPGSKPLNNLYAMPIFMSRVLPTGVIGLMTAAMLAAFMSTHDSYLLCWSSVITQDIVAPIAGGRMGPKGRVLLTRILIVAIGLYILYWGLAYKGKEDIWDYMAVSGAIYFTGAIAVLVGGLYWRRASSTGATLALLCGFSALLGLSPVQRFLEIQIPSARVGLATIALTAAAMIVGSLLFPDRPERRT